MIIRSFATSLSPFETNTDYIFFFMLLLSDEINLSCLFVLKVLVSLRALINGQSSTLSSLYVISDFHFLYHYSTSVVYHIGPMYVCCDFIKIIPFTMKDIIFFTKNDLGSKRRWSNCQCFCYRIFVLQTKFIRLTVSQSVGDIGQLLIAVEVTDSYAKKHMFWKFPLSTSYSSADILQQ